MQNKTKRFIAAGCLAAAIATAGLAGCSTEDRSAGRYMDDRRIAGRVEDNLNNDPAYKFKDVHVSVFDGVAQLSGFVDAPQQITIAADRAARTEGVREVINDISLKPQFKLVPASSTGAPGLNTGENKGSYQENFEKPAPIVTPNQGSPATPPTGNNNKNP